MELIKLKELNKLNEEEESIIKNYGFDPTLEILPNQKEIDSKIKSAISRMKSKDPINYEKAKKRKRSIKEI